MIRPLLWLPVAALCLTPALAQEVSLKKQAQKLHALAGGEWCDAGNWPGWDPERAQYLEWTFTVQPEWEGAEEEAMTLIRLFCMAGAYNVQHSYYLYRESYGLRPVSFAVPTFDIKHENDDVLEGALLGITLTGMGSDTTLTNSLFDEETLTLESTALWRGIGDASSTGVWQFREGGFALVRYEVDASYDGEMNPEVLVNYTK